MKNGGKILIWTLVALVVAGGIYFLVKQQQKPGELDTFAQCLNDKGAIFYGAFWCPHCQNQKKLFGRSERLLNYVECSTPDGRGQVPFCTQKEVAGYPTWEFADGSRLTGEISLQTLAEKTGCTLAHPAAQ